MFSQLCVYAGGGGRGGYPGLCSLVIARGRGTPVRPEARGDTPDRTEGAPPDRTGGGTPPFPQDRTGVPPGQFTPRPLRLLRSCRREFFFQITKNFSEWLSGK